MGNKICCKPGQKLDIHQIPVKNAEAFQSAIKLHQFLQSHPTIKAKLQYIRENMDQKQYESDHKIIDINQFIEKCRDFQMEEGTFLAPVTFEGNVKNGLGIMLYNDKGQFKSTYYEGYWRDDQRDQWGIYVSEEGDLYVGGWKNDTPNGKGYYKSDSNKSQYYGQWVKGEKSGRGKQVYPNGDYFQGQFKNDMMEGEGIFVSKQQRYEGGWRNGVFDGAGKTEWYDEQGKRIGSYVGEYKLGKKDGYGEYTDSKGSVLKTTWCKGKMKQNSPMSKADPYI